MAVYFLLYFGLIAFGLGFRDAKICIFRKRQISVFPVISFCAVLIVEGCRRIDVGVDTWAYVQWFTDYFTHGWDYAQKVGVDIEPGFRLLNLAIASFSDNPQVAIFVFSFIILGLLFAFMNRMSTDYLLALVLFFGLNQFNTSMASIRQYIAMGIVLWALPLLQKKKYLLVVVCATLSYSIHQSSILFIAGLLVAYIFRKHSGTTWVVLLALLCSIPFAEPITEAFEPIFPKYFTYYYSGSSSEIGALPVFMNVGIILLLIYAYFFQKGSVADEESKATINICCTLVAFSIFFTLLPIGFAWRMSYSFRFILIILIPMIAPRSHESKLLYKLGVYVGSTILFTYYLATNAGSIVPYYPFWV